MKELLLPSGIISLVFMTFWLMKYPDIIWHVLTFQYRDGWQDTAMSIATWFFMIGANTTLGYLVMRFL